MSVSLRILSVLSPSFHISDNAQAHHFIFTATVMRLYLMSCLKFIVCLRPCPDHHPGDLCWYWRALSILVKFVPSRLMTNGIVGSVIRYRTERR